MKKDIKFEFRFPSITDSFESQSIYEKTYDEAKSLGVLTKEEMGFWLKKHEIFTATMETEFTNLEADNFFKYPEVPAFSDKNKESRFIEKCIIEITKGTKVVSLNDLLFREKKEEKHPVYLQYRELNNIKHNFERYTCEGLAETRRTNYLVSRCVWDFGKQKLFWDSYEEMMLEQNNLFISLLASKLIEFWTGFSSTVLRKIARHPVWRTRWIGATKLSAPLFSGNISEWDINKTFLVYWSNFYDNIYTNDIEDFIIKDDKLLDAYLETKARDRNKKTNLDGADVEGTRAIFAGTKVNPIQRK